MNISLIPLAPCVLQRDTPESSRNSLLHLVTLTPGNSMKILLLALALTLAVLSTASCDVPTAPGPHPPTILEIV